MKTIVVGYDETEPSKRARSIAAAELAQAFGAKLIVTSVAPVLVSVGRGMGAIDPVDPPSEHLAELEHVRAPSRGQKAWTSSSFPAVGEARGTRSWIFADERPRGTLIVVGTREPNVIERFARGRASASRCHANAHCDVLIVH